MSEFTEESCPRIDEDPAKSESSSGYYSSSPPTPTTPQSISPPHTLKRSRTSSFRLINRRISTLSTSSQLSLPSCEPKDRLADAIGWYPAFLIRIYLELFKAFFVVIFKRLPVIIPTIWISAWMWVIKEIILTMFSVLKNVLAIVLVPSVHRMAQKRTILISGGSSVQALHLARNFASAGARVIMCEVDGQPSLGRFSTSVHQFYTVPKPEDESIHNYLETLKFIVIKERAKYYIPVSEVNTAYYDALVKPHLEELGCECLCPDVPEVFLLDDTAELMRTVQEVGLPTPNFYPVLTRADLNRLYDSKIVKKERHFMVNTGSEGCKNKIRMELPCTRKLLVPLPTINETKPWLVIKDYPGEKYVTCTTVKGSQVVCNVTCKVDDIGGVVPVEKPEIEQWLKQFFAGLKAHPNIIGHLSFHFIVVSETNTLLPTDCQVGVRLPYICYTSVQSRILWKPCKHFRRHKSGPVVTDNGKYWLNEVIKNTWESPSVNKIREFLPILWGKNDALFLWGDPLPFYVYYYVFLPMNKISSLLKRLNSF